MLNDVQVVIRGVLVSCRLLEERNLTMLRCIDASSSDVS